MLLRQTSILIYSGFQRFNSLAPSDDTSQVSWVTQATVCRQT